MTQEPPLRQRRRWTRRALLRWGLGVAGGAVGGTAAYSAGIEPFHPVLERVTVPLPNLPPAFDGFTIALLSDLHATAEYRANLIKVMAKRAVAAA